MNNLIFKKINEEKEEIKMIERSFRESTENWVRGLSAISQNMIERTYLRDDRNELTEITPIKKGDTVYHFNEKRSGEIVDRTEDGTFMVKFDDGETIEAAESDIQVERDRCLPMWGTMWSFTTEYENEWLRKPENLQIMAECGFRIYDTEDGIYFGIDGCGYDFFEYHWIPLYKAFIQE